MNDANNPSMALFVGLLGCGLVGCGAEAPPPACPQAGGPAATMTATATAAAAPNDFEPVSRCTVLGVGAKEADRQKIRGWLADGAAKVHEYFAPLGGPALMENVTCVVFVWGTQGPKARIGLSLSEGLAQGSGYMTLIHFLAPSVFETEPHRKTSLGQARDEWHHRLGVIHEYVGIALDQSTQRKPSGWALYKAPSWFYQGYEEYLGATLSSEHGRTVTLPLYQRRTCDTPSRVSAKFEKVEDVYGEGVTLLSFLHEEFGADRMRKLLASPAADFWAAIEAELGTNVDALYARWEAWKARRCPAIAPGK